MESHSGTLYGRSIGQSVDSEWDSWELIYWRKHYEILRTFVGIYPSSAGSLRLF